MNIVAPPADEPLYLPAFFARLLAARRDIRGVFCVRPRYGSDSALRMLRKYAGAFGLWNTLVLARRTLAAKVCDRLGLGRGRGLYYSVSRAARAAGVPCELVEDVNDAGFLERLRAMKTDLVVSVSCPQIFRKPLIALPPLGCLNVHGALLPQYRGIAPSFWMMANGEPRAGVTVFLVNEKIDAGDVVVVEEFDILPGETLDAFIVRSKRIHCDALLRAIERLERGDRTTTPLRTEAGSYYSFPTRSAYREFRRRGRRLW
ncbi:MAG TPA: formyltransferase family protein [Phycisphaerae bacterium]|nr:formyltransferase family protein [Phycisphaerae bacterium]